jgi:NADH dehydrogenase FAD-containing subunit
MTGSPIQTDVLIIGAGYAGRYAAARLHSRDADLRIVVVEPNDFELHRTRSHQHAAGERLSERRLTRCLPPNARHIRAFATQLDPERRRCLVRSINPDSSEHATISVDFQAAIVATGSRARVLDNDGSIPCLGVDDRTLHEHTGEAGRIAVVGAGLSGVEMASELAEQTDARIELVAPQVLPSASQKASGHARTFFEDHDVALTEVRADCVRDGELVLENGEQLPVDAVVSAIGFEPTRPELTTGYGGPQDLTAHLNLDAYPNVFFAGDASGQLMRNRAFAPSCALSMPMGIHAAENVVRLLRGRTLRSLDFGVVTRFISLGRNDGIIDFKHRDGRSTGRAWTGRIAAVAKERILRMTEWALTLELKTRLPIYDWPKGQEASARDAAVAAGGQS